MDCARRRQKQNSGDQNRNDRPGQSDLSAAIDLRRFAAGYLNGEASAVPIKYSSHAKTRTAVREAEFCCRRIPEKRSRTARRLFGGYENGERLDGW